jgi:ribosomal protein S18 acetylase RimI-like enzyme
VNLRPATPADLPRIHAIRHGVSENVLRDPSKVSDEEVAWYMVQAIFLVSEEEGEVVGFTCANHQTGLVWALFIDPAHERRGHGRALLDEVLRRLATAGHRQAWLTTGAGTRAQRFYAAHGWRDMGRELGGQVVFVKAV